MKAVLTGLILLCVHTGAAALDGRTSLQWSDQIGTTLSAPQPAPDFASMPELSAHSVLVFDQASGQPLLAKNATLQTPIASITKLMTAMLVIDAAQPLDERITITDEDRDTLKGTGSRLAIGARYTRGQLLHLALIASDNRAAHALGRSYPGGLERFVATMNRMARALGMHDTVYVEPTGLSSGNRSTALDLAKLVDYAYQNYPEIRRHQHRRQLHPGHPARGGPEKTATAPGALPHRGIQQHQSLHPRGRLAYRPVQNRLHQRSRPLPGDAGAGRRPRCHHRAARRAGHQPSRRRRHPHQGLAGIQQPPLRADNRHIPASRT